MQFLSCLWLLCIFFCHYSHQQAWSTVTQKKKIKKSLCLACEDRKENEKALHIYIKKFGATRLFFWQSSQSSYMSVSRLSFLVICDMISDSLILKSSDLKTCVEIQFSHNTDRIKGGRNPLHLELEALFLLASVWWNYQFPHYDLSSKNSLCSPPNSDWKHWQAEHYLLSGFLHSCTL